MLLLDLSAFVLLAAGIVVPPAVEADSTATSLDRVTDRDDDGERDRADRPRAAGSDEQAGESRCGDKHRRECGRDRKPATCPICGESGHLKSAKDTKDFQHLLALPQK